MIEIDNYWNALDGYSSCRFPIKLGFAIFGLTSQNSNNSMKIRIGNDVRVKINIFGDSNEAVNIKSIDAYVINKTKQNDIVQEHMRERSVLSNEIEFRKNKIQYISRFPVEPNMPDFCSSPYDVCCSGRPCYNAYPRHLVPVYPGLGVIPHTFEPHTWGRGDVTELYTKAGYKYMDMDEQYKKCEFRAPVKYGEDNGVVYVYFPANCQLYTGVYTIILVLKVYEEGFMKDNIKTVTMQYDNAFELVNEGDNVYYNSDGSVDVPIGTIHGVESANIVGPTSMIENSNASFGLNIYPSNAKDYTVQWSVSTPKASIYNQTNHDCMLYVSELDNGAESLDIILTATIGSVTATKTITITKSQSGQLANDRYVSSGEYTGVETNLTMSTGDPVTINMSPQIDWSEPYGN